MTVDKFNEIQDVPPDPNGDQSNEISKQGSVSQFAFRKRSTLPDIRTGEQSYFTSVRELSEVSQSVFEQPNSTKFANSVKL